jgi:RES domain-containing protein
MSLENEIWYRGRCIENSRVFENKDMLPPNPEKVSIGEGRFNHYGQSHFYLGNSEALCLNEICKDYRGICWIQKVNIKSINNIIDLSGYLNDDNYSDMPLIFSGIMHIGLLTKKILHNRAWKPEYFVSRFIADICKENKINGIKYSSSVAYGENLVLFFPKKAKFEFIDKPYLYKDDKNEQYENKVLF